MCMGIHIYIYTLFLTAMYLCIYICVGLIHTYICICMASLADKPTCRGKSTEA